jgi:hypothetical protein
MKHQVAIKKLAAQKAHLLDSQSSQLSVAGTLNYQSGFANTVLSDILQSLDCEAIRDQIPSNQEEGRQAMESLLAAKRLTAGLVFKSGRAWLGPEVPEVAVNHKRKRGSFSAN